uniref:C2H2-type domain-containing protein n=1 Tax=Labrus bergylta TaxID=56723 RepID=A0A3Q3EJ87_9LABR
MCSAESLRDSKEGDELRDSESTRKTLKHQRLILILTKVKRLSNVTRGEAFEHESELLTHQRVVHSGQETHTCKNCGKVLSFKSELTIHTRTHTGEKTYSCSTCGKRFSHSSHLKVHSITPTDERPFTCRTFGRTYRFMPTQVRYHTPAAPVGKDSFDDQT